MMEMLMGHLWGDYLLQNNWMALNKTKSWAICLLHCLIYSTSVCLWIQDFSIFHLIFLSHFPIDYWGLGQKWLDLIRGRNFLKENQIENEYKTIMVSFSTLVYAVVDNTLHITLMYFILKG